ncbi:hypothetical protein [uncultured Cohaesibacter sp.]|uniref:hypothetical protein n=1 Tax=uncultured Cohaesibacter sp. TaxID=1002546 RepID=UPI00292CD9D7|nr:hypothetical protein [uncultured Cohaesibacter sp.]
MARIAVVYSGISFQHQTMNMPEFRGRFDIIDIYDLPRTDLSAYDGVIFPRSTDQAFMATCRQQIEDYLNMPGIVVALGDYWQQWLPGCTYGGFTPEDDEPLSKVADHPILEGISSDDLHWHKGINGLCCHGHLEAPEGANVLIRNDRGDCILYEDHSSTKGIVVAGSQFDVFCHTFSNDSGAKRALTNMLNWIGEEGPRLRAKRKQKPIAVAYSGLHFQHNIFTRPDYVDDFELLPMCSMETTDLLKYRVLVIPRESNQEVLYRMKPQIRQFLNEGRTIVSFGEMVVPWLPEMTWQKRPVTVKYDSNDPSTWDKGRVQTEDLRIVEEDHALFQGITLDDMKWHFHGVFNPLPGQRSLLCDGEPERAVILLDESNFDGKLMVMTLDPEEHAGFGEVTITMNFLNKCIEWIREEADRIGKELHS